MTGISFATDVLTVHRPTWMVQRNDRIPDWSNTTTHTVSGCRVQPLSVEEIHSTDGTTRDAEVSVARVFAPPAADISAYDRVSFADITWEVEGRPVEWRSPTGMLAHRELTLRRVQG